MQIIKHLADTSVEINGVFIPGGALEKVLSKYVLNVMALNDHPEYQVMLKGSGTCIRYRERSVLLCTQHQLAGAKFEDVGILDDKVLITAGGARWYQADRESDGKDLVAFDFSEPVTKRLRLRSRFFEVRTMPQSGQEIFAVLLFGCPYEAQCYDIYEANRIGLSKRLILCELDPKLPTDNATLRVIPLQALTVDPDGLSGGAAFIVSHGNSGFQVQFGGIIIRGGRNNFTIIKVENIMKFIQSIFDRG